MFDLRHRQIAVVYVVLGSQRENLSSTHNRCAHCSPVLMCAHSHLVIELLTRVSQVSFVVCYRPVKCVVCQKRGVLCHDCVLIYFLFTKWKCVVGVGVICDHRVGTISPKQSVTDFL